jgi:SpoIID/LytB domain protein
MDNPTSRSFGARAATVILSAALAVVAAAPAGAQTFRFHGSGWGHGIGMSQYGALGLAQRGWGAARILGHYYTAIRIQRRDPPKQNYRVGLLQNRSQINITVPSGPVTLRLQDGTEIEQLSGGNSRRIVVTNTQRYRIVRPDGSVVGGQQWGGPGNVLQLRPGEGGLVRVSEWGRTAGRGWLVFPIVAAQRGHLVAVVGAEQYLYGLGEVPSSWPMAVLKAQAIAGRSYAYRAVPAPAKAACACDILGDTRDQAYIGWDKESSAGGDRWVQAVDGSARQVALHNGEVISTLYSSSSGGYTENAEIVWGGSPVPYLKGVCDPGDFVSSNPNRLWSVSFGAQEAANRLGRPNGMTRVTGFNVTKRGVSGRVAAVTVRGRKADGSATSWQTTGWTLRSRLPLKDTRFWVNQNRQVTGKIRQVYDRIGCRPGLATSNQKAINGGRWQRFQRGRMYLHAGRNRVTWVRGPILKTYTGLRAHNGRLRLPWNWIVVAGGQRARFDGGDVFFKKGVGDRAYMLHGRVLNRYLQAGGPSGNLGFPRSGVRKLNDGRVRALFQGGTITCRPGGGCTVRRS